MSKTEFNFKNLLFNEQNLKFEDKPIDIEKIPVPKLDSGTDTNIKFGILNLTAIKTSQNKESHEFIFMVDCSGSMSDGCSDGRCKMQHIIHTLKNIIIYFKENPTIQHYITINAFDEKIYSIINHLTITEDNFNEVISKIDKIIPRGSTDIELALRTVSDIVSGIKIKYPGSTYTHIFMTDGEVTTGDSNPTVLVELVDKTISNAFIGFGIEHDTVLLNKLGNNTTNKNNGYYFIDKLENAGLVYGEILHGIFYKYLQNVKLEISNGLLYDFKINKWTNTLEIGNIVSEVNKIFHVISSNPNECFIKLTGFDLISESEIQIIITSSVQLDKSEDLIKYVYRQRTLQYLYLVNDFVTRKNDNQIINFTEIKEEEKNIKKQLREFINEMKKYMCVSNMDGDKLMKNLCDDIYISYRTFESKFGAMYVNSRQTSQGTQRFYTPTHTPTDLLDNTLDNITTNKIHKINNIKSLRPPKLTRQVGRTYFPPDDNVFDLDYLKIDSDNEDLSTCMNTYSGLYIGSKLKLDPDIDQDNNLDIDLDNDPDNDINHELSGFKDSPYLTHSGSKTIHDISIGTNIGTNINNYDEEYDCNDYNDYKDNK